MSWGDNRKVIQNREDLQEANLKRSFNAHCCFFFFESTWKDAPRSKLLSSVQSLSHVQLFATPRSAARQASLSITNFRSLPKPMSIESGMPSNHLILCRPLLLLPSIFPSMGVFSNESVLSIRWPKYWSFSISPSNEYSVQLSDPYVTTGKTIALTRWTFLGKVMSLLFNMLSRLEHFQAFYNFSWANNSLWILIWFLLLNQCGSH